MKFLRWAVSVPVFITAALVVYLTAPLIAGISMVFGAFEWRGGWATTHDGLDGYHYQLWVDGKPMPLRSGVKRWVDRTWWLWRNPAAMVSLGVLSAGAAVPLSPEIEAKIASKPFDSGRWACLYVPMVSATGSRFWSLRMDIPWWLGKWWYVKLWLGWTWRRGPLEDGRHNFKCNVSPFLTGSGA